MKNTALELEKFLHQQIPLTIALGARVLHVDEMRAEITAPLEPNRNHLGTAFGASLYAALVLSCYAWLFQTMKIRGHKCHVVLKSAQTKYLKPVKGEIRAICPSPGKDEFQAFIKTFEQKGRAQVNLRASVVTDDGEACTLDGIFVVSGSGD
jgi:thioesterase domain-containing protein